jgi:TonB family protein
VKLGLGVATLGLALLLVGEASIAQTVSAQDTTEGTKRKVKTRVVPEVPPLAKQLKVAGKVKIEATISADGHVTNARVVGGNPVLVPAAVDAIKKWRYESGPKESTEIVEFEFSH